jgi:hypothetical protein
MGVERVDYYSDDDFPLQHEVYDGLLYDEYEPDQIDMMSEDELREELRKSISIILEQRQGEFICKKCGLRQENKMGNDSPF